MKTSLKIGCVLLCVLLLLPLTSCSLFEEKITAEILLLCNEQNIPSDGDIVLTVRIDEEESKEYGAVFSPDIDRNDLTLPLGLDGKQVRVDYQDETTIFLHFGGKSTYDFGETLSLSSDIVFAPSAFSKNTIVGHLFCNACRPYLVMTNFSGGSKDDLYTLHFTLETRATNVKTISAADFELQNLGNPGEEIIDVMPGEDGKTLTFSLEGVRKEDESKPFVLVLKESVFTLGKPIEIEIPAIGEIVLLKQFVFE